MNNKTKTTPKPKKSKAKPLSILPDYIMAEDVVRIIYLDPFMSLDTAKKLCKLYTETKGGNRG